LTNLMDYAIIQPEENKEEFFKNIHEERVIIALFGNYVQLVIRSGD